MSRRRSLHSRPRPRASDTFQRRAVCIRTLARPEQRPTAEDHPHASGGNLDRPAWARAPRIGAWKRMARVRGGNAAGVRPGPMGARPAAGGLAALGLASGVFSVWTRTLVGRDGAPRASQRAGWAPIGPGRRALRQHLANSQSRLPLTSLLPNELSRSSSPWVTSRPERQGATKVAERDIHAALPA